MDSNSRTTKRYPRLFYSRFSLILLGNWWTWKNNRPFLFKSAGSLDVVDLSRRQPRNEDQLSVSPDILKYSVEREASYSKTRWRTPCVYGAANSSSPPETTITLGHSCPNKAKQQRLFVYVPISAGFLSAAEPKSDPRKVTYSVNVTSHRYKPPIKGFYVYRSILFNLLNLADF